MVTLSAAPARRPPLVNPNEMMATEVGPAWEISLLYLAMQP